MCAAAGYFSSIHGAFLPPSDSVSPLTCSSSWRSRSVLRSCLAVFGPARSRHPRLHSGCAVHACLGLLGRLLENGVNSRSGAAPAAPSRTDRSRSERCGRLASHAASAAAQRCPPEALQSRRTDRSNCSAQPTQAVVSPFQLRDAAFQLCTLPLQCRSHGRRCAMAATRHTASEETRSDCASAARALPDYAACGSARRGRRARSFSDLQRLHRAARRHPR